MAKVRISAVRFASLLANRNMTPDMVVQRVTTAVRPHDLAAADQEVEFEDLLALAARQRQSHVRQPEGEPIAAAHH